jgi:dihydroorotase
MTLRDLVLALSVEPRRVLGLPEAVIREGAEANLTFLRTDAAWTVDRDAFYSKSRNTPFHGWPLKGRSAGVMRSDQFWMAP